MIDRNFLKDLGLQAENNGSSTGLQSTTSGDYIKSYSPVDGEYIGSASVTTRAEYDNIIEKAQSAAKYWRTIPAPKRGEIVRLYGEALRKNKEALGKLVSYEMGKSLQEGYGEVQEMIDICDFAVGLSRQLYGLTMHSERPGHRMYEQWHPVGLVGIISAFNFPVAVWAWNCMVAMVCGDVCIWKPSEKAPLCAVACQNIFHDILKEHDIPEGVCCIINGNYEVGKYLTEDTRIPLISATGSTRMGKIVGATVGGRLGRHLLELGGNNAIIVTPESDTKIVMTGAVFGAIGTAGQRCTSTRRLIIHESQYDEIKKGLVSAYGQVKIGNPLDENNHMGPVIDQDSVNNYLKSIQAVKDQGGTILVEGKVLEGPGYESGCYVSPTIAEATNDMQIVQHETFGPLLYLLKYSTLDEAIAMQNDVPQGLSSAIMTDSLRAAEQFLSNNGSDCGIANVNIGTSGAEIGGAFGGEKETGGGRESGSDAWKAYMRRQTNTINYSTELPLAQGIKFDL